MASLIFLLGGARSGKSDFALRLARGLAGDAPVLFIATAQAGDGEMAQRIARHRSERPSHWQTLEAPLDVGRRWLAESRTTAHPPGAAVLDCLTLLVANLLFAGPDDPENADEAHLQARIDREIDTLLAAQAALHLPLVVVSNEVGLGIVPAGRLSRLYRDLLGRVNRRLAAQADQALFLLAGIPLDLKRLQADLPALLDASQ